MTKDDITYKMKLDELIQELNLSPSLPNSRRKHFICVEGDSDVRLFRKLVDLERCKIEQIPGGKAKVEECVEDLSAKSTIHSRVIGIRDADFEHLKAEAYTLKNMFLTDFHDIEMTMLAFDVVLNALFFEYTNLEQAEHTCLKNSLMLAIRPMSCLKLLNERESLLLSFEVGFEQLLSFGGGVFSFDFETYLQRVLSKSKNPTINDASTLLQKVAAIEQENLNLLQLTNGHDLLKAFAVYFREVEQKKGTSGEDLEKITRIKFDQTEFQQTALYQQLLAWQQENKTQFLKP